MHFLGNSYSILEGADQVLLLIIIVWLYIWFLYFSRDKKISKTKHFFAFISFVYVFFLLNFSFLPMYPETPREGTFWPMINLVPFSTFSGDKQIWLSMILLVPAWFLLPYFLNNFKKTLVWWLVLCVSIELLQLVFYYISIYVGKWIFRPFSIDDIILRICWFMIWLLLFKRFEKLLKK